MLALILYLILLFGMLVFLVCFSILTISFIYSSLNGSPYVPTSDKLLREMMNKANLKKGMKFVELGSGDGRITRFVAKEYKIKGIGYDINGILVWWSNLLSKLQKVPEARFETKNIFHINLTDADVLYIFLMPRLIEKLKPKMEKELKKNTLVISHGFLIVGWEKKLKYTLPGKTFNTYYYHI